MSCEAGESYEWKFVLQNGNTDEMRVTDELLDSEERAWERATSEFLKNGYSSVNISFLTYLDDININDTLNIEGIPYLVKGITTTIDSVDMAVTIRGVRYE